MQLYKTLVRPHWYITFKYGGLIFKKDIDLIEGVQRTATKLISDLKNISYEDILHILNIITLETRRLKGDLIEVFEIFKL